MIHNDTQNHPTGPQRDEQEDAEATRLRLMKSLTFEQKLAWLDWAQRQVAAKYGWKIACQNDHSLIDVPRFEVAHLQLIQQTQNPMASKDLSMEQGV